MENLWEDNEVQFPRLIAELDMAGAFTPEVMENLCESMDLSKGEIFELILRATEEFDIIKSKI